MLLQFITFNDLFCLGSIFIPILIFIIWLIFDYRKNMDDAHGPLRYLNSTNKFLIYDASFSEKEFLSYTRSLFLSYHKFIQNKNVEPLRSRLSAAFFSQLQSRSDSMRTSGQTEHTEDIVITDNRILGWKHESTRDILVVKITASLCKYTTDDLSGKVISGNSSKKNRIAYYLEFARTSGTREIDFVEKELTNCPKCGGDVYLEQAAVCPYCGAVLNTDHFDWILTDISSDKVTKDEKYHIKC